MTVRRIVHEMRDAGIRARVITLSWLHDSAFGVMQYGSGFIAGKFKREVTHAFHRIDAVAIYLSESEAMI